MNNPDQGSQEAYQKARSTRQQQPSDTQPNQSRPMVQPIIMGTLTFASSPTQTTVGSAGTATALPAKPTGYLQVNLGSTLIVVPFYAAS